MTFLPDMQAPNPAGRPREVNPTQWLTLPWGRYSTPTVAVIGQQPVGFNLGGIHVLGCHGARV